METSKFRVQEISTVQDAIKVAKAEVKNPYAQAYLKAIPDAVEHYGTDGFKTQLLYVMSNLAGWRGENARRCKGILKAYLKDN